MKILKKSFFLMMKSSRVERVNNLRYAILTLCHQLLRILKNLVVGSGVRAGKAEKALRNRYVASRQIITSSVLPNELCKKGIWLGPG